MMVVESSSSSTPQCVDSAVSSSTTSTILRRRQVPTLASENYDDDAPNKIIRQEEEDDALSRCEVSMNKSDDLVAEEDEYIDNENRDLQSLIELRYVHDGKKQYATKDGVAIRVFEGIQLLPSKSISFIVSADPCGDTRVAFYIALLVWCLQVALLVLLLYDDIVTARKRYTSINIFGLPVEEGLSLIVSKYISTFLMVFTNFQIPETYSQMFRGYDARMTMFDNAFPHIKNKKLKWHLHNLMNFFIGGIAFAAGLVTILSETTVRDVLLSFATITTVTSLDNIAFNLCINQYLGRGARAGALEIFLAKYNYDHMHLPLSDTKFCGYGLSRVAYLDGKIRFLTMLALVGLSFERYTEVVIKQRQGTYRCSQKIIDDNLYNVAKDFCSERKTLQNNTFEVISDGDRHSISDVPFVMAVKRGKTPNVYWTIRDPNTMQKIENGGYGNILNGQTGNSVNGFDDVYLYYTCLPRNITGIWSIERGGQDNSDFFLGFSEIYKIKSEVLIDGREAGEEICVDDTQVYSTKRGRRRLHEQSHLIGDLFNDCAYDINFGDGECNEEYNTVECAYDAMRCLSKEQNNTLSKQSHYDQGIIGGAINIIQPIATQDFVGFMSGVSEVVNNTAQSPT